MIFVVLGLCRFCVYIRNRRRNRQQFPLELLHPTQRKPHTIHNNIIIPRPRAFVNNTSIWPMKISDYYYKKNIYKKCVLYNVNYMYKIIKTHTRLLDGNGKILTGKKKPHQYL